MKKNLPNLTMILSTISFVLGILAAQIVGHLFSTSPSQNTSSHAENLNQQLRTRLEAASIAPCYMARDVTGAPPTIKRSTLIEVAPPPRNTTSLKEAFYCSSYTNSGGVVSQIFYTISGDPQDGYTITIYRDKEFSVPSPR